MGSLEEANARVNLGRAKCYKAAGGDFQNIKDCGAPKLQECFKKGGTTSVQYACTNKKCIEDQGGDYLKILECHLKSEECIRKVREEVDAEDDPEKYAEEIAACGVDSVLRNLALLVSGFFFTWIFRQ